MSVTISILIGNTDDKLGQKEWSSFVRELRSEFELMEPAVTIHFSGFPPGDAMWQNFCLVLEVDSTLLGYTSQDTYLNDLRYILSGLANRWDQDSIALLVGETEFITDSYITEEMFDDNDHGEEVNRQEEHAGEEIGGQEGHAGEEGSQGSRQGHDVQGSQEGNSGAEQDGHGRVLQL